MFVGKPMPRKEDARHLLGGARFTADMQPAGVLHVAFLRSPHSHARILEVDASACKGVAAVLTSAEVRERTKPFSHRLEIPGIQALEWFALAQDTVRYVGEPVLALAASSRYAAEDALDSVEVEYEPLQPISNVASALAPGAPRIYDSWPDNRLLSRSFQAGDVEGAFERAALVVERRFESQRYSGFPLETRGCLAEFSPGAGQLSVWSSTQWPHPLRTVLAELLRLPESRIRVTAPDVGGGFGNKQHMFSEEVAVCLLAMKTGRPVKWIEDRRENLAASVHACQQEIEAAAAADADGVIQALRVKVVADMGAAALYFTGVAPQLVMVGSMPGPYRIENYAYELECVVTNKCPVGAYRGFGRPQATFAMERLMDVIAGELKLDPAEIRRRNLLEPGELPYRTVTGGVLDSGRYREALELALRSADYDHWRGEQAKARSQQRYLGIGLACFVEATAPSVRYSAGRWAGYDAATARLEPDGHLAVYVGISSHGQGLETSLSQVAADALGVEPNSVSIFHGDTSTCPYGLGTFGSRSAIVGGVSVARA
ncbi:MAG: xanthine dehydrogenase family protein molybdopterin-binding subunit, partial [Chloroflexota bacterium]